MFESLVQAFESLDDIKHNRPDSLTQSQQTEWRRMRHEIERQLFHKQPPAEADRREHLRVPTSLSVRYWSQSELKDRYMPELGEGGLFVSSIDPLPVGSRFELEICLTSQQRHLKVTGEVVWVKRRRERSAQGMGIKFVDLDSRQKDEIHRLVHTCLRDCATRAKHKVTPSDKISNPLFQQAMSRLGKNPKSKSRSEESSTSSSTASESPDSKPELP